VISQKIENCVKSQTDPEVFSGVVHLSRGDNVLFERGYGYAIRSESIPIRTDTRFQMASGSKVFTAIGVLRLIEEGRIEFITPLSECIDVEFPNHARQITVGHLLTHSSGITSYFEEDVNPDYEAIWQDIPMYRIRGPRDFVPLLANKPMKFSPGEKFEYNDGGFVLLGLVIECATGQNFTDYMKEAVLVPAGMADSGYFASDMLPGRTAYAYIRNTDGGMRTNFFAVPVIGAPDGGACTTAFDMAHFWRALLNNKMLSEKTVRSMLQAQIATDLKPPYGHYGHGVWIDLREDVVRKIFVEGYDPGVAFRSSFYPNSGTLLTMLGNTSEALWPLYRAIENELDLR
jgi:CubicO group peptidase (beta-lactamase class C family)